MPDLKEEIGKKLRKLRGGNTLFQVATETGIGDRYISLIEKGKANITLEMLEKLCKFYNVDVDFVAKKFPTKER